MISTGIAGSAVSSIGETDRWIGGSVAHSPEARCTPERAGSGRVDDATRPGSIDVEILLYLLRHRYLTEDELEHELEHQSGLLGLGGSARVEELESSAEPKARLALDVFAHQVAGAVARMAVSLGGLDAIVFTAGIGEGSAKVRSDICARLGFLGVALDPELNNTAIPDTDLASEDAAVRVWIVRAREDIVAARAARKVIGV